MIKKTGLNIRISQNRLNKLRLYAVENEKTMTQVISDFIDSLKLKDNKPNKKQEKNSL